MKKSSLLYNLSLYSPHLVFCHSVQNKFFLMTGLSVGQASRDGQKKSLRHGKHHVHVSGLCMELAAAEMCICVSGNLIYPPPLAFPSTTYDQHHSTALGVDLFFLALGRKEYDTRHDNLTHITPCAFYALLLTHSVAQSHTNMHLYNEGSDVWLRWVRLLVVR